MIKQFVASAASVDERLDAFLSKEAEISRSSAVKAIEEGRVLVDGSVPPKKLKIKEGMTVTYEECDPEPSEALPQNIPLDILHEDADVIVVNKPKGMVVHPAAGNPDGTLVNALLYHCKDSLSGIGGVLRPGIVHRIDKDTSGLLVVAKNDESHIFLSSLLKDHKIERIYYAVVVGTPKEEKGTVSKPIGRHRTDRKRMAAYPTADGQGVREAITHYEVLSSVGQYSLLRFRLETGRTHQIRVHMSSIGHPIIGDTVYGAGKTKFETQNASLLQGQCLHAKKLTFPHPKSREELTFESEFPDYFKEILRKLELSID